MTQFYSSKEPRNPKNPASSQNSLNFEASFCELRLRMYKAWDGLPQSLEKSRQPLHLENTLFWSWNSEFTVNFKNVWFQSNSDQISFHKSKIFFFLSCFSTLFAFIFKIWGTQGSHREWHGSLGKNGPFKQIVF